MERKVQNAKRKVKVQSLKFLVLSLSFALFALHFTISSYAQPVSSAELISKAKDYDGRLLAYEGEVIGDIMVRGGYAWINVNDGKNAVGIWLPKELTKDIIYTGSYKTRGDRLEITGIFYRACSQHGGDLDIHAQTLKKISLGRVIPERLNTDKRNLAIIFLGILFIVWILRQLIRS